ncbi:MAG: hypothetical protein P0Y64_16685 [Candidatus Sphingomonas colombiensis]|nr:hypothetical protein [Sphingomonas sp.]WEK42956.1 MAG: hypothetical protein P0Y64_16685 [Sphingomonas sp.]
MSDRLIVRPARLTSASKLIDTLAESLSEIKEQDELTDADLGGALGKGADQGAKYRTGLAEMGLVAFLRGCERWNGRFANDVLALIGVKLVPIHAGEANGQSLQTRLAKLMLEVSVAMEDGILTELEIHRMQRSLVEAGEAIDALRENVA